tara:strand:- start:32 stop:334 length:303 start_codon:yes stop_codon:yes gene_type:complete
MSEYHFDRVNSKGEVIFRRDTNESLEDVENYLTSKSIEYEVKEQARMIKVITEGRDYSYYYTTGRWSPYKKYFGGYSTKKHYKSNGIEDFITRFIEGERK